MATPLDAVTLATHTHVWQPALGPAGKTGRVLLMLHGTGGNERSLLPLAQKLDPGAAVLSPRGNVLEHGAPRFFRRLAEGVLDEEDVVRRAGELARWLELASAKYGFSSGQVVAVGYSNGANVACAMLMLHGAVMGAAALLRPMMPLRERRPAPAPSLAGVRVLISSGAHDPICPPEHGRLIARALGQAGALVQQDVEQSDHSLTHDTLATTARWLGAMPCA